MKIEKDVHKVEFLKRLNLYDITNIIISIIGIIVSNYEMVQLIKSNSSESYKFIIYNVIICLVIAFVNIYGFFNKRQLIIEKMNVEELEEKNKNLLEVNDNVRCFKHDFNNIIQALEGCISLEDMESLHKYFNSLLKECNHMNVIDFLNCQASDNPAIYSVLLNKYKMAEERNIKMNIDILVSLNKFKEKSYEISRMLGILIDNALEATIECKDKVVNVQFLKEKARNKILIIIENTYIDKNIDTKKIFEKNYTTKKDKGNSGLGLWKIRDILKKDTSLDLYTTKDATMFKQQLEIYEKQEVNFILGPSQ